METAIRQLSDPNQPGGSRVKQTNLLRVVNRTKQKLRPSEPQDLDFEVYINITITGSAVYFTDNGD